MAQSVVPKGKPQLTLNFHGRIIDHLGIQMYQSPVAAVAEIVSNAWDADAETVEIELPTAPVKESSLVVRDDGNGMTYEECDARFLEAGYDKREGDASATSKGGRPLQGRKGIGKFAGFGIAEKITVATTSAETGERTVFVMDLSTIRGSGKQYAGGQIPIECTSYDPPDPARRAEHGTVVTLEGLQLSKRPNRDQFATSMARRFLQIQEAGSFEVKVDGDPIPEDPDAAGVQFTFPGEYAGDETPDGLVVEDGWALEDVPGAGLIRWRIRFYEETIEDDELRGVAVFAEKKLAQRPFFFNITRGVHAQNGMEYMTGQVDASYLDHLDQDVISTERQRVNWEHPSTAPVLEWGQGRTKQLLRIWNKRRGAEKLAVLEDKLSPFAERLANLQDYERPTVKKALAQLATLPKLSKERFESVSNAVLTAWEHGRLRNLIAHIANVDELDEAVVLDIIGEAEVLTALSLAESVKAKVKIIAGLEKRIQEKELENPIRDYVAEHPWLLSPRWESFRVERSLAGTLDDLRDKADRSHPEVVEDRRVDLLMSSGPSLLVVEFMRPGKSVDRDHLNRFEYYVDLIREHVEANTAVGFSSVEGLLVADRLSKSGSNLRLIRRLRSAQMDALDWPTLLGRARAQWSEYFDALVERAPDDARVRALSDDSDSDPPDEGELADAA